MKGSRRFKIESPLEATRPVPETGIYRILHPQHRLPKEVTLLRSQVFPVCSRCPEPVRYRLVRSAPDAGAIPSAFVAALHETPEVA